MPTPRDICGAIKILATRVEEVYFIVVQSRCFICRWLVMDNGTICSHTRGRFETWPSVELSLLSELRDLLRPNVLIETMVWLCQLLFQESKVLHDSCTISDIALPHSFLLNFVFTCL